MGLIQNKVKVSQPNSHVVVKNAGGLRGLTGETGPQGPQGVPGEAATITAGTTTTLPAGSDATVQNVGSTSAAIFNFGIPKGDKGDTGESGAAATISVGTTTTLEPGEDATVTNSGTSSAAVFDFGIPKGAKGDTGSQGPAGQDGADGFSPTATVTKTGDTATITITDKDGTTTAQISDGVTPTIDPALSPTSENPVQNKVVTNALAGKADKPIVVSSLPATGTAGQEYFVDDRYNTVTELKGDTEQTTYSGKNKYSWISRTDTPQGLSSTYDATTGMIHISGTSTATWSDIAQIFYTTLPAGTYTLSLTKQVAFQEVVLRFTVGSSTYNCVINTAAGNTSNTITIPSEASALRVYLGTSNGRTYDETFGLMLESGSTATSFEPYVGGTASPNPDYPQEVQTVTGRQVITISDGGSQSQEYEVNLGKNLLNGAWKTVYSSQGYPAPISDNVTITDSDNNNVSFTTTTVNRGVESDYVWLPKGTNITVSFTGTLPNRFFITQYDSTKTRVSTLNTTVSDVATTTVTTTQDGYITVAFSNTASGSFSVQTIQLEKGSTATTYAPYIQVFGKNLLNPNTFVKGRVDSGAIGYASDTSSLSTTATTISFTTTSAYRGVASALIPVKPNTTYTSSIGSATTGMGTYADFYDATGTWISRSSSGITISTPATCAFIRISYQLASAGTGTITNPMVEESPSATTYEPNISGQLELCKIGTYQDYIYKSGEDWYVHNGIEKLSVNFSTKSGSTANNQFSTQIISDILAPASGGAVSSIMSNRFISKSPTYIYANDTTGIGINTNSTITIGFGLSSGIDTVEKANTYASTNEIVAYYPLATPTDYQITYEPLITQLEALAGAKIMVDGGTATVTSQYLPATLTTAFNSDSGYIDYIYDGTNFVKVR